MPYKNKEDFQRNRREYRKAHPEISRGYRRRLKREVINKYGGRCACCGEEEISFLTIDHVNGGGTQHRRDLAGLTGYGLPGGSLRVYSLLRRSDVSPDYQILCFNCNFAKGAFGVCPHKSNL